MRISVLVSCFLVLASVGCTHTYSVKLDGDVEGTDRDTPRAVRCAVLEGAEASTARQAGVGHLRPLTDAEVTVAVKMKGEDQVHGADSYKVDSRTAEFHIKKQGEGKLAAVLVRVSAPGRKTVEQEFPTPSDVPFEALLMGVLDEAIASAPSVATPASAPTPGK
jgi:hypothetical protein